MDPYPNTFTDADILAAFLADEDNLGVPGGLYGSDTYSCAPIAVALAVIVADSTGEPITRDDIDNAMGLVVNSHDDVLSLIRDHGSAAQRALIADLLEMEYVDEAREMGRQAARNAASWTVDGNTKPEAIRYVIGLIDEGDDVSDYLPRRPDLSGEWAGDPTPYSLAKAIIGETALADMPYPGSDTLVDAIADAFEEGVSEVFEDACETELRNAAGEPA